jgi:hypothetical protein
MAEEDRRFRAWEEEAREGLEDADKVSEASGKGQAAAGLVTAALRRAGLAT